MKAIPLVNGGEALVNDTDFDWLNQWTWRSIKIGRFLAVVRHEPNEPTRKGRRVYMHRAILNAPAGSHVSHRDENGFNNQRANLLLTTGSERKARSVRYKNNTSGFKGVSWRAPQKWHARISVRGKAHHLGYFDDLQDAAAAYWNAAQRYFGEFARAA